MQAGFNRRQRAAERLAPPFLCRAVSTRARCCSKCAPRNGTSPVIYLDTSALVKLIRIEAESDTLGDWLDERTEIRWITSALAEVELPRAIRAVAPALVERLNILEAAERAGIYIDLNEHGIGVIYTRAEIDALS